MIPDTGYLRHLDKTEGKAAQIPHEVAERVVEKEFNLPSWRSQDKKGRL